MKLIGYALITLGFLAGALTAVFHEPQLQKEKPEETVIEETAEQQPQINWLYFGASMTIGVFGIAMVRVASHQQSRAGQTLHENMQQIDESMERIVQNMGVIIAEKEGMSPYDFRHRIDELFIDDITVFIDARESIAHRYGLASYADIMSDFAAGERYLNRVWSASADGYIDEIHIYLDKAAEQFKNTLEKIKNLDRAVLPVTA